MFRFCSSRCLAFRVDSPVFSCATRTSPVERHPPPQVVHRRLNRDLRGSTYPTDGADRLAHRFLPAPEHRLHPRPDAGELLVALVDLGLVKTGRVDDLPALGLQARLGQLRADDLEQHLRPAVPGQQLLERSNRAGIGQVAGVGQADKALPARPVQPCVFHRLVGQVAVELLEDDDLVQRFGRVRGPSAFRFPLGLDGQRRRFWRFCSS